jgi:hypothetical protein
MLLKTDYTTQKVPREYDFFDRHFSVFQMGRPDFVRGSKFMRLDPQALKIRVKEKPENTTRIS